MADRREGQPRSGQRAGTPGSPPAAERERVILLECRLDQLRSQLEAARAEADYARARLAESTAREADHARRCAELHAEVAEARAELAAVHERLERAEALRAELEGSVLSTGPRSDARELLQLRREVASERQRALVAERSLGHLRARVEELLASREILFTRMAEWQQLVREDGFEAADLSEYLSELRREVLDLERRNTAGEDREAALRGRLLRAGLDPDAEPIEPGEGDAARAPVLETVRDALPIDEPPDEAPAAPRAARASADGDRLVRALAAGNVLALRAELTRRLGRGERDEVLTALRPGTEAADPTVRAAAYEALGRVLEGEPGALEPLLRAGLADADTRVRRRVVLAVATARGVALRSLLEPLRTDPDLQVQRVVREVLRHAPPAHGPSPDGTARAAAGGESAP